MKNRSPFQKSIIRSASRCAVVIAALFGLLSVAQAQQALPFPPVHRYTFDNASGALANGALVLDSIGSAHGVVRGAGATAIGSGVRLPGGSSTSAAYIDLPNGVISGTDQSAGYASASYEAWVTVQSAQSWSRIFDFGTNSTGEISGPGGTFTGTNYLMVSANIDTSLNMRFERSGGGLQDTVGTTVLGTRMHVVVTYDASSAAWKLYKDGTLLKTLTTTLGPSTVPDLNVWLGRSNWSGDSNADATYDEFRIYDYALGDQQVLGNYQAGPDTITSQASQTSLIVDPPTAMTGTFATEWNTAGNFENWTLSQVTGTVTGGTLQGTASGTDSRVSLSNFAGGPDLDLGFNDFLELRIQVPASYTGPIQIFFGTTSYTIATASGGTATAATTGFNSSRVITISSASIPKDGAFHTYRIDLGLVPLWRATLRDLRIDPLDGAGTSGMAFAIDYVRVGDEPNAAVYQTRTSFECPAAGGSTPAAANYGGGQTVLSMESKHFRFLWNAGVEAHGSWNAAIPRGTLRNLEEIWQLYVKKLGYVPPNALIGSPAGTKVKMNMISWYAGYWAGVNEGYAYSNITPDGLRVDPPSWVLAHEGMHCFQFHTTSGNVPGEWFEFHANYGQELYLDHYRAFFPNASGIDPTYLRCAHQAIEDGRDYYLSWPIFLYLDENPDALPDLGPGTVAKLWSQTQAGEYSMMALERVTPSTSLKDIAGYFARRGLTYDYSNQVGINASLARFGQPLDNAATARWQLTDLVQRPDDPTWWRVPYEMAPMQGAYAIHELVPAGAGAGRTVSVNLRGLPDAARGADWRASFIVIDDSGAERYSTLWGSGTNSVTLGATENKVYLSVAGAPATFYYGGTDDAAYPYRSHAARTRFPYELQVTGAAPKQRDNGSTSGLTQHSNGGGYRSVSVPSTVYIGPNARVLGGTVSGNARIEDYALVTAGTVSGNAVISGHAWVRGGTVTDNAKVRDWALVEGGTINGSARLLEHANIKGGSVTNIATAKGTAASLSGTLSGNAIIDGNYGDFFSGRDVANGVAFGHVPYEGVPDSHIRALPTGLYAAYSFAAAHDSRILDAPGVTDGFTVGSPVWVSADAKRKGFLTFDGTTQHVNLDRSVADLRDWTFTAWVKPLGGAANQAVLWLGASTARRIYFTADDGSGKAKFSIVNGGAEQTLTASSALAIGVWSHVAITLNGTTGTLYVNGAAAASGAVTLRAESVLPANTATALPHLYLARAEGSAMPRFRGALDEVQFYATALAASDIAAMQPATSAVSAGTLYVDLRASDASAGTATWTNNGTIGNFTRVGAPALTTVAGVPAVQFNGTNQAYSGPNTVADLDGASDRSIEVWAYNPALAAEETTVSWGYRGTDSRNMAFNFGSHATWGAATHWGAADVGWGTPPSANAWHHLAYTYDGATSVKVYIDGALANTNTLSAPLNTYATQPLNIASQRDFGGATRSLYFSGYLNSARVHGGVLTAAQIAANYSLGPVGVVNTAPTLATIGDQFVNYGVTSVSVVLSVGDSDTSLDGVTLGGSSANLALLPSGNIAFSGSGSPRSAMFTPIAGQSGTTSVTVTASDGAATVARTFNVTVLTAAETWRRQNFGSHVDSGNGATLANPDGDALLNVWEYFHGTNPQAPGASPAQLQTLDNRLVMTFPRNTAATDVSVVTQGADDPAGPWTDLARSTNGAAFAALVGGVSVSETGPGALRTVEVRDLYEVTNAAHPQRYLRLRVLQP